MEKQFIDRFIDDFDLKNEDIIKIEDFFQSTITTGLKKRFLSHLVSTIEDLVNDKQKHLYLKSLEEELEKNPKLKKEIDMNLILSFISSKNLRLFSIILRPLPVAAISARINFIKGCAIITYDNRIDDVKDIRLLLAHELGHLIHKHFFPNIEREKLSMLFAYIAICDKNDFYQKKVSEFTHNNHREIYNRLCGLCKK